MVGCSRGCGDRHARGAWLEPPARLDDGDTPAPIVDLATPAVACRGELGGIPRHDDRDSAFAAAEPAVRAAVRRPGNAIPGGPACARQPAVEAPGAPPG